MGVYTNRCPVMGEREGGRDGGGIFMTLINQIFDIKSTMVSLHMF